MPLHPLVEKVVAAARAAGRLGFSSGTPDEARMNLAAGRAWLGPAPDDVEVRELRVPTRGGGISARLFKPSQYRGGLVAYLHGGGWVCGSMDDFDGLARSLAALSGCAILLPDYRLAPEHPFPAGMQDTEDTLSWCAGDGRAACGALGPLMVAGDSAGANLAASAAINLRGKVDVAAQVFFYPVTDCDFERDSYQAYSEDMPLSRDDMQWFFTHYAPPAQWPDGRISVLRSERLAGSPATWIATAEYDVLRDEGEAYAQRLSDAGVPVRLHRAEGLAHGFARLFNHVDTAREVVRGAARALAAAAGHMDNH
jgi:acetyl esterase